MKCALVDLLDATFRASPACSSSGHTGMPRAPFSAAKGRPDALCGCVPKTGVKVERSAAVKDELIISGNDIELVSKSAALINYQACTAPGHL